MSGLFIQANFSFHFFVALARRWKFQALLQSPVLRLGQLRWLDGEVFDYDKGILLVFEGVPGMFGCCMGRLGWN